jgi:TRAP-type C4-dicarboxylate transport system substrate-binding protein
VSLTAAAILFTLPATVRAAEPTVLKFGFPAPPGSYLNVGGIEPWSKRVMADADGAIEIKVFPGGSIANFANVYDRVVNGVAEIGLGTVGVAGVFPRTGVSTVPFVTRDSAVASRALWRIYAAGATAEDFTGVRPLTLFAFATSLMHSTRRITTAADLNGLKIGVQAKMQADMFQSLGAAPVTMTSTDLYQSLQRGVITGASMSWSGVQVFKLAEVAQFHLDFPIGPAAGYIIMNKDAYARLPQKAREAIDRHSGENLARMISAAGIEFDNQILNRVKAMPGHEFHELAPQEVERWRTLLAPITEEWARNTPDGAKVLEAYKREVAAITAERR